MVGSTTDGVGRRVAASIAERTALPTPVRAILGYYADSGQLSVGALQLQRTIDRFMTRTVEALFEPVEDAIAREVDAAPDAVEFEYDTKLTLPAELTLGQVYYRARRETPDGFDPAPGRATSRRFAPVSAARTRSGWRGYSTPTPTASTPSSGRSG